MTDRLVIRRAWIEDLGAVIALLADDPLGSGRESSDLAPYFTAFDQISADPNQFLAVAVSEADGRIVGTLQLSFIAGLSRGGMRRGLIEAVRVASDRRGEKIGEALIEWAISTCREEGCGLVQLTTDKSRTDAHRFYDRLGFEASHLGYKRML